MVIHEGGRASGFKNSSEADSYDTDGTALFHVKGTTELNTHAVQVEEKASSLNSADCFVLITPTIAYVWNGRGSNSDERAVATSIAYRLASEYNGSGGRDVICINETSEPDDFWLTLGGKTEYLELPPGDDMPREPRLFWASTATGSFKIEEVDNFEQDDLIDDDVMILDTYTQVFIWIGSNATEEEKRESQVAAKKYIDAANDGRSSSDTPIIQVSSGNEPIMFTNQFHGWDYNLAEKNRFADPYAAKLKQIEESKKVQEPVVDNTRRSSLKHVDVPISQSPAKEQPVASTSPYNIGGLRRVSLGGADGPPSTPPPAPTSAKAIIPPVPSAASKPTKWTVPVAPSVISASMVKVAAETVSVSFKAPGDGGFISYESLKGTFPSSVDPAKKEEYLSDADFNKLFGTTKDAFNTQPKWKKDKKKKELGLF